MIVAADVDVEDLAVTVDVEGLVVTADAGLDAVVVVGSEEEEDEDEARGAVVSRNSKVKRLPSTDYTSSCKISAHLTSNSIRVFSTVIRRMQNSKPI